MSRALALAGVAAAVWAGSAHAACPPPRAPDAYGREVLRALASGRDLWGEQLLRAPGGPTYARAARYLRPLLYARTTKGRPLTDSGVYYVPLGDGRTVSLHVADGGEILRRRVGGPKLTISVGGEPYGSCLARLGTPTLAGGWLPILETSYRDRAGVRWRQESFTAAGRSWVRLQASRPARARVGGTALSVRGAAWFSWPGGPVAETAYDDARAALVAYWTGRLATGTVFVVPERRVLDAERALLVQNLQLAWRYSLGNPYEEFSFPESVDNAEVMSEYGFGPVARTILLGSLTRRPAPYPNWKMGEKLLASAEYLRLTGDRTYATQVTPTLRRYVAALGAQLGHSLLDRERYSSDIPDQVYGLHSQAVVWQALRAIGDAWPDRALAARARALAARLGRGLRRAVARSQRRLPDGSLFLPVRLLDREPAYAHLTDSRDGSYWNLVAPYALASGLFPPGSPQARGALAYIERHGSRLLGLVRAGAFALYGPRPPFPVSGTDQVYGVNVSRFLADNDQADQLVLSLYGQLAAGMTPGTFVAGEGASVAPLPYPGRAGKAGTSLSDRLRRAYAGGLAYRAMYLPPNSTSNAAFLETLRLMLVHETPTGLELAFATPRAWLAPGKRIAVERAPTSFGPLSYSLTAAAGSVAVSIDVPPRARTLRLRLRLPHGTRTLDLSGRRGRVELRVGVVRRIS